MIKLLKHLRAWCHWRRETKYLRLEERTYASAHMYRFAENTRKERLDRRKEFGL